MNSSFHMTSIWRNKLFVVIKNCNIRKLMDWVIEKKSSLLLLHDSFFFFFIALHQFSDLFTRSTYFSYIIITYSIKFAKTWQKSISNSCEKRVSDPLALRVPRSPFRNDILPQRQNLWHRRRRPYQSAHRSRPPHHARPRDRVQGGLFFCCGLGRDGDAATFALGCLCWEDIVVFAFKIFVIRWQYDTGLNSER